MSSNIAISLGSNPIEKDYDDYICAYFQNGGLYFEKSIIHVGMNENIKHTKNLIKKKVLEL